MPGDGLMAGRTNKVLESLHLSIGTQEAILVMLYTGPEQSVSALAHLWNSPDFQCTWEGE